MKLALTNGRVVTPFRRLEIGTVVLEGERILEIVDGPVSSGILDAVDRVIDVEGRWIAPGFIDTHVHGGGGADVMDGTVEALQDVAKQHAIGGTTSFSPTTVCAPIEDLLKTLETHEAFAEASRATPSGAQTLGVHLEGPYLNPEQAGALDPASMKLPREDEYLRLLDGPTRVIRMTVAPELPGALELGRELQKRGCIASIGHSSAQVHDLLAALDNGYTLLTHFYSGMMAVHRKQAYRFPGLVELGYLQDHLLVEVIADGAHLPTELLKLIYKVKGADRIILTTDAMRAAGLPEGEYVLGNQTSERRVIVEDGVAKLPDRTAFAGSVALMDRLIRTMVHLAGVPLESAVQMATYNPARLLGVAHVKGTLAPGKDADITVLDEHLEVTHTLVRGTVVFEA